MGNVFKGSKDNNLDDLLAGAINKTSPRKKRSTITGPEAEGDSTFMLELTHELKNSQLSGPIQPLYDIEEDLMTTSLPEESKKWGNISTVQGGAADSVEDAAQLIMMLEMMVEHQKAQTKGPPRLDKDAMQALKVLDNVANSSHHFNGSKSCSTRRESGDHSGFPTDNQKTSKKGVTIEKGTFLYSLDVRLVTLMSSSML